MDNGNDGGVAAALPADDVEPKSPVEISDEARSLNMPKVKGTHLATPLHTTECTSKALLQSGRKCSGKAQRPLNERTSQR